MEIRRDMEQERLPPTCVAVGVFDGVHVGHQAVLRQAVAGAREAGLLAAALTFDPHPERVLRPRRAPLLLTTIPERAALIAETGIEVLVIAEFDREFANLTPEEFARCVLAERLTARCVVAGEGFVFGRGATGSATVLAALGEKLGFQASAVRRVTVDGAEVSSTMLRQLISAGEIERAAILLGHCYAIRGAVVPGDQRGRDLGFPTANIRVDRDKLLPANGVYAAWARPEQTPAEERHHSARGRMQLSAAASPARIEAGRGPAWPTVVNIGVRPTFGAGKSERSSSKVWIEAHVLDGAPGDLYGRSMTVEVVSRLREEKAFANPEALAGQIRRDIARAKRILGRAR